MPSRRSFLLVLSLILIATLIIASTHKTTLAQTPGDSATPAGVAAGLELYDSRCASCHGPAGLGDGELAADLPNPPAALSSPDYLRQAVPADMFAVITNGRQERGMPPFGPQSSNPLNETERWQLVAAIYELGTPAETLAEGQRVYEANCADCHGPIEVEGEIGNGAGEAPVNIFTNAGYWLRTSDQMILATFGDTAPIPDHQFELSPDEGWAVIAYVRNAYSDPLAALRPLPTAQISGQVINGTTGQPVEAGTTAQLRAFTPELDVALTMTTTVDMDGRYHFDLTQVPPNWFYRVGVNYEGIDFGSNFGQLRLDRPELDLPITVYDKTTDPTSVYIEQIHLILDFVEDQLRVGELYVFSNDTPAIFVGESGDPGDGTVRISVPAGATNPAFERSFGSFDSFVPATEVIAAGAAWTDTLPVRPGRGTSALLVRYQLPYQSSLSLSHPVHYDTANVTVILPDSGVNLANEGDWVAQGRQQLQQGSFVSYARSGLAAGDEIRVELSGRPRQVATVDGSVRPLRNETAELAIGGGLLLLAVVAAAYVLRSRQNDEAEEWDRDSLLEAIADLDDAYESGEIDAEDYRREREELKAALVQVWNGISQKDDLQ